MEIYFLLLTDSASKPETRSELSKKARKLVKKIASQRLNLKENDIIFSYNENGKPFLENHPHFHFTISHSSTAAAVVFSDSEIGIDIEKIREADLRIAKRYFTEAEFNYITSSPENSNRRFFEIWTKKEAYIKRHGLALKNLNTAETHSTYTTEYEGFVISVCSDLKGELHIILENPRFL